MVDWQITDEKSQIEFLTERIDALDKIKFQRSSNQARANNENFRSLKSECSSPLSRKMPKGVENDHLVDKSNIAIATKSPKSPMPSEINQKENIMSSVQLKMRSDISPVEAMRITRPLSIQRKYMTEHSFDQRRDLHDFKSETALSASALSTGPVNREQNQTSAIHIEEEFNSDSPTQSPLNQTMGQLIQIPAESIVFATNPASPCSPSSPTSMSPLSVDIRHRSRN